MIAMHQMAGGSPFPKPEDFYFFLPVQRMARDAPSSVVNSVIPVMVFPAKKRFIELLYAIWPRPRG